MEIQSHWFYKGNILQDAPDGAFGFIYKITNLYTGKMYIGRKQFNSKKRKALTKKQKEAGRVKRKIVVSDSDWRVYMGSNKPLLSDIHTLGKHRFKFEILAIGYTKGEVNYLEENLHHKLDVTIDPAYYNDAIGAKKFMNVKISESSNQFLSEIRKNLVI